MQNGQMLGNDKETDRPTDEGAQDVQNRGNEKPRQNGEISHWAREQWADALTHDECMAREWSDRYGCTWIFRCCCRLDGWNFTSLSHDDVDKNGSIVVRALLTECERKSSGQCSILIWETTHRIHMLRCIILQRSLLEPSVWLADSTNSKRFVLCEGV